MVYPSPNFSTVTFMPVKSTNILGISCFYHDSAACLVRDGEIIAAVQEERFSRKKHDSGFPLRAIEWCLASSNIKPRDLDFVVYYERPFVNFSKNIKTAFTYSRLRLGNLIKINPCALTQDFSISGLIRNKLGYRGKILFFGHHESHAASAFFPSPFKEAAILVVDGSGECNTISYGVGKDNDFKIKHYLEFPHSLGLLYSAFTHYIGFEVNSGEYKLMGLAPYGEEKYTDLILNKLINLKEDGSFKLNMEYFDFYDRSKMISQKFEELFGGPPRMPEAGITQKQIDIAASIQKVTEEIILRLVRQVHKITKEDNLCLSGEVALNCVANGRILREGPFKKIWIQPASGDAGAALGAALLAWYKYLGNHRLADGKNDSQKGSLLGPSYSDNYIEEFLKKEGIPYKNLALADIPEEISNLIMQKKVIGWFQGRAEFGPRSLGARSIIADARDPEVQSRLNLKIKFRESFRPFAPSVLREHVSEWFDLDKESPYMLLVASVREDKRIDSEPLSDKTQGFGKLKIRRSVIPAVTHVDYSARVQTIKREDNPLYYDMIRAFYNKTGCPVILNTSFNVRGEPLVCSPEDAFKRFMTTEMDYLIMGRCLLDKKEQKPLEKEGIERQKMSEPD